MPAFSLLRLFKPRDSRRKSRREQALSLGAAAEFWSVGLESLESRVMLDGHSVACVFDFGQAEGDLPVFDPSRVVEYGYSESQDSPQEGPESATNLNPPGGSNEGLLPLDQTFTLHSLLGANRIIYLDFNGHTTSGTRWNNDYGDPIVHPPFSLDADTATFSDAEQRMIQETWQLMVEDFAPFNIDVTTEDPGVEAMKKSGAGDTVWGTRVVFCVDFGVGSGGVAYLNSFADNQDDPAFVFYRAVGSSSKGMAEAGSHEVGHNLGLSHDGINKATPTPAENEEYYGGHGTGDRSWGPIMGVGYYTNLTQWSKGEYISPTNTQDDLVFITEPRGYDNGVRYRADDHPSTIAETLTTENAFLQPNPENPARVQDDGIIERNTDADFFMFSLEDLSEIELTIRPFYRGPNLDILAEIYNEDGVLELTGTQPAGNELMREFRDVSLPAGNHFLKIDGEEFLGNPNAGNPNERTGYTDYGSLGYYDIDGVLDVRSPKPTGIDLLAAKDTGTSNSDDITSLDNSLTAKRLQFSVTGTVVGAQVSLYADDILIGTATAPGATTTVTTNGTVDIPDGVRSITARQQVSGIPQSRNNEFPLLVTIDTIAPAPPTAPDLVAGSDTGLFQSDNVTNDATPTFTTTGNYPPGEFVNFFLGGVNQGVASFTGISDGVAGYTFTFATLGEGVHSVTAAGTDVAGNVGTQSQPLAIRVDTTAPLADIVDVTPDPRNNRVPSFAINFAEQVTGFERTDLTLRKNNGSNLLTGGQSLVTFNSQNFTLTDTGALFVSPDGGSGNYRLTLLNGSGIIDLAGNTINSEVVDDFTLALPAVAVNDVMQGESAGTFTFTLTLTSALDETVTVDYAVVSGNAIAGADFSPPAGAGTTSITFDPFVTSRTVTVGIINDDEVEQDEVFFVNLSNVSSNARFLDDKGLGTIVNDDLPRVSLAVTDASAGEAGLNAGQFTVTRTGPTGAAMTVYYTVGGTATSGADYQPFNGTVVIPVGQSSATIALTPVDDDEPELPETVTVTLLGDAVYTIVNGAGAGAVTVVDNDLPRVTLAAADPSAAEQGAEQGAFRVTRNGPTTEALEVFFAVTGTATPGEDFSPLGTSVVIPVGQSSVTFPVIPVDEQVIEQNETVIATLTANPSTYRLGAGTVGTVTIVNRAPSVVQLSPIDIVADEFGLNTGSFVVSRTSPTDLPLTVLYTIAGTATNGADYQTLTGSVDLAPGQSSAVINIVPVDDAVFELTETVTLALAAGNYIPGQIVGGTVTMGMSDGSVVQFGLPGAASYSFTDETGDTVKIGVKGPGLVRLYRGFGQADAEKIELIGSSPQTALTIGGNTSVGEIDILGSLGKLTAKGVELTDGLDATGSVGAVQLGRVTGGEWNIQGNAGLLSALSITNTDIGVLGTLTGLKLAAPRGGGFSLNNSNISAAAWLGKSTLGVVNTANGGQDFGLLGVQAGSVSYANGAGSKFNITAGLLPHTPPGDFFIRVV